ncbi:DEAD/DEAH box helicase [Pseudomonas sp. HAR-UPW-AIA-41]|uniref:DEAD/DEAH box helicase n=1 Tax=Pseudomonas sp. HAR-UPW-AIA-41 TaxID=1985301 RepID=UPI000BB3AE84|nr:DEAD/DEAH box helicase [Pseudomonas sp. HAR-UPW-AIA-41]PAV48429.1 DEAD/DEAH box helicase [Pseudomonas sp. HAR-UPW-AIA-41]
MSFTSLGLSEALAQAVEAAGYTTPTPVQQRAIPAVLQGRDLMVAAQTGTGKTGGFALPVLELLFPNGHPDREHRHGPRQPRVLVLTPTRELAAQVHDSFKLYARDLPLTSACIFGGVGMKPQVDAVAKGVDVLVACPGRLLDLVGQGSIDLSRVEILVLDEADRMLDMGFIHDVKKVLAKLPAKRQNLLFSATFSKDITDLANKLLHNPERIEVTPPNTTVERIEQRVYRIGATSKRVLLAHLITQGAWEQVLVFTRTKHGANRLAEYLCKHGLPAAPIHGNKSQNARTKALADFKANTIRILVATDIAARGLDIDQLPHVVNYELPNVEEDYVHRIGRTGRAGRAGEAISLVAPDEERLLKDIERLTKQRIADGDWMGFDLAAAEASLAQKASEQPAEEAREARPPRQGRQQQRNEAQAAEEGAAKKKRRRRGGKNKGERSEQAAQADGSGASPAQAKPAKPRQERQERQPQAPRKPVTPPADRDPEEFLDDDYDNFGNSVDYVPVQPKAPARGQRRPGQAPANRSGASGGARQGQPGSGRTGGGGSAGQSAKPGKPRAASNKPRRDESRPRRDERQEPAVQEQRSKPGPMILRKGERLPSLEQLNELDNNRRTRERPALLSRNRDE